MLDPFAAQKTLILFCDVHEPSTGQPYNRDPRSIAKAAEKYMGTAGIGDTAVFGPEAEFLRVRRRAVQGRHARVLLLPRQRGEPVEHRQRNMSRATSATARRSRAATSPVPPVDSGQDLRAEMVTTMSEMGVVVEKHHHEVAPSQHELGIKFGTLVNIADHMQIYKYVVHMVAHA